MIGYTYITTITTSKKTLFYGGKKMSSEFKPKYFGSGRVVKMIKKTGKASLFVEIHEAHETLEDLNAAEIRLIAELRAAHGKLCVNINDGGDGFDKDTSARIQNTPSMRKKRIEGIRTSHASDEYRDAARKRMQQELQQNPSRKRAFLAASRTPEVERKRTETRRKLWATDEYRAKMIAFVQDPDRCAAVSRGQALAWKDAEVRARRSAAIKEAFADPVIKARKHAAIVEANQRPELRQKRKAVSLEMWNRDPAERASRVAAMQQAMNTPEAVAKRSAAIRAAWARRKAAAQA